MSNWLRERFDKLTGKFKHYCDDFDGLPIDENCPEFDVCTCFPKEERP